MKMSRRYLIEFLPQENTIAEHFIDNTFIRITGKKNRKVKSGTFVLCAKITLNSWKGHRGLPAVLKRKQLKSNRKIMGDDT